MKYRVLVKGVTPYLQHRMDEGGLAEWEKNRKKIIERPDANKSE